jgi:hypothetical protein
MRGKVPKLMGTRNSSVCWGLVPRADTRSQKCVGACSDLVWCVLSGTRQRRGGSGHGNDTASSPCQVVLESERLSIIQPSAYHLPGFQLGWILVVSHTSLCHDYLIYVNRSCHDVMAGYNE